MGYYEFEYPDKGEIVFVKLNKFSDSCIYFDLVEYDNVEGFLNLAEMDKKLLWDKKYLKHFVFDRIYPMYVIDLDDENENNVKIDLSYKRISEEEKKIQLRYYDYIVKFYRLVMEFSQISNIDINTLLPLSMWNIIKKENIEEGPVLFKKILENPELFVEKTKEKYSGESQKFIENIKSRITSTNMEMQQNFNLTVYSRNAIAELKNILAFDSNELRNDNIDIYYTSAPKYKFIVLGKNNDECKIKIDKWIDLIRDRTRGKNVEFNVDEEIVVIKEREINLKFLESSVI